MANDPFPLSRPRPSAADYARCGAADWAAYRDQLNAPIYPSVGANVGYAALGLCGEAGEVLEHHLGSSIDAAAVVAELGDVCWYVNAVLFEAGIDPGVLDDVTAVFTDWPYRELCVAAAKVAELAKKAVRDDDGVVTDTRRDKITAALIEVVEATAAVALESAGSSIPEVHAANVAKVHSRAARGVTHGSGSDR